MSCSLVHCSCSSQGRRVITRATYVMYMYVCRVRYGEGQCEYSTVIVCTYVHMHACTHSALGMVASRIGEEDSLSRSGYCTVL